MASVADLAAPYGESNYVDRPNKIWLAGGTTVEDASLVQDLVAASGVRGLLICESNTGDATVRCSAGTQIAQLRINGQPVALPQGPIPRNYPVAITGGEVQINVLGLPISVPVSGTVTLNETTVHGVGTDELTVEHAPLQVQVSGNVAIAGLGLVGFEADIVDYTTHHFIQGDVIAISAGTVRWFDNDDNMHLVACSTYGGTCEP